MIRKLQGKLILSFSKTWIKFLLLVLYIFIPLVSFGQCFITPNNPIGGSANMGTLNKKNLRVITFYRHLRLKNFLKGDKQIKENWIDNAHYDYAGALIGYGISDIFSLESELGYFIDKRINYQEPFRYTLFNDGFSNLVISGKIRLYHHVLKRWEIAVSGGVKTTPFHADNIKDGVELPINLWTSTESTGFVFQTFVIKEISRKSMRFFLHNRYERNFENELGYNFGQNLNTAFYLSRHLWVKGPNDSEPWTIILQLRNELTGKYNYKGETLDNTGSIKFLVSPQINYTWKENWNFSIGMDYPVYQYFHGVQLSEQLSFSVNLVKDIHF